MTPSGKFARRKARGGKGLIPPNPKHWEKEHNGLDLRDDLSLGLLDRLDHSAAFTLLPNVVVCPHGEVPAARKYIEHLRGTGRSSFSGIAIVLPYGTELVCYNDAHPDNRIRSTLMEEFFHIHLQHPRSRIRVYADDGSARSYNKRVEEEAFGSGAAALVPYAGLKSAAETGSSVGEIAQMYEVSEDLVLFRAKVTKCYKLVRRK